MAGKAATEQKTLNLALQGGGAHGAFTWGVLDYFLEDGRLDFEGVSATSAGAMNAVALAYGKSIGGNDKAREVLENFWREISDSGAFYTQSRKNPFDLLQQSFDYIPGFKAFGESTNFAMFETMRNTFSPYQLNPLNLNPLKDVLDKIIDFDEIHKCECLQLFISATDVQHGTSKIFSNAEVTQDVVLASACLPFLFQAQEIDGRAYWDGGYMGNPALWPLFYNAKSRDILIVHINPITREDIPKEAYTIENRINEITFNTALMKELRAIAFVKKLIRDDMLKDEYKDQYKDVLLHAIRADDVMKEYAIASKFNTDWSFLQDLRDKGRAEAKKWLRANYKYVNEKASVDIEKDYLQL